MKRTISIITAAAAIVAAVPGRAGTLQLDPANSRIEVAAKATGHSFTGKLDKFSATVRGDSGSLAPSAVSIGWDFADLKTGEGERDSKMLEWLNHKAMPKGSFTMTKGWTDDGGRSWLQGNLKIHGVSKQIAFPYTAKRDGGRLQLDGEVWIDHQDFKLPIIRTMAVMKVDPKLRISFHLVGDVK